MVRGGTTTVEFGRDATQVDVLAAAAGEVDAQGAAAPAGPSAAHTEGEQS